jgi:hypothetical protein
MKLTGEAISLNCQKVKKGNIKLLGIAHWDRILNFKDSATRVLVI